MLIGSSMFVKTLGTYSLCCQHQLHRVGFLAGTIGELLTGKGFLGQLSLRKLSLCCNPSHMLVNGNTTTFIKETLHWVPTSALRQDALPLSSWRHYHEWPYPQTLFETFDCTPIISVRLSICLLDFRTFPHFHLPQPTLLCRDQPAASCCQGHRGCNRRIQRADSIEPLERDLQRVEPERRVQETSRTHPEPQN